MVGSEAIRRGVKQGVDEARMSGMMRELVDKIGMQPGELKQRVEALEAKTAELQGKTEALREMLCLEIIRNDVQHTRLDRHRVRIRWLERWRANPNL